MDEAPVWIAINGARAALLVCSPSETDALAVGYLVATGAISGMRDVRRLRTVSGPGGASGVEVEVEDAVAAAAAAARSHLLEHGCGPRHVLDCAAGRAVLAGRARNRNAAPELDPPQAFRSLFAAAETASPQGGVHAAALSDGSSLHHAAVDVARHCAVDRAIGLATLAGDDPAGLGLLLTSRISGAIALKAAYAGLAWVASRSLATPLAREIAGAARIPLLEQAVRGRRGER